MCCTRHRDIPARQAGTTVHAFHTLVYLDVEKSGSTFVSQFLRDFLDDDEVVFAKHVPLWSAPPRECITVLSVRDPLDTYLSLYSYGCQGRGGLHGRLRDAGRGGLYDGTAAGFTRWAEVVLEPASAPFLDPPGYHRSGCAPHVGLLSYRTARLAVPRAAHVLRGATSAHDVVARFREHAAFDEVLRSETLADDLAALVRHPRLAWRPSRGAALEALRRPRRLNSSERLDRGEGFAVPTDVRERVYVREPILARVFGYGGEPGRAAHAHRTSTSEAIQARSSA
jgi:hypothetical protein